METNNLPEPVWKQPRGSYGSNYWEFFSLKLRRAVHFYSNLEWDHGVLIEADPSIVWYCEQPVRVTIKVDGRDRDTVLDMLVRYRDGREEYREVKHESELVQRDKRVNLSRQLEAQRRWAQVVATSYRIVTERQIRTYLVLLSNWRRVLAYLAATADEPLGAIEEQVMNAFHSQGVWRLTDLEQTCRPASAQLSRAAIYRLIHRGALFAPLHEAPLSKTMLIRRASA